MIDNEEVYNKIIKVLKERGPSLPMHIAKEIGMSSLFISAFLSEMMNQKRVKMSHMKVGSAKLYLLPNQEPLLEKFIQYLNPKETEAVYLLKEKKLLKDSTQEPSIRVALRSLKDFAQPIKINDELYWKYISIKDEEIKEILNNSNKTLSLNNTNQKSQKLLDIPNNSHKSLDKIKTDRKKLKINPKNKEEAEKPEIIYNKYTEQKNKINFNNPLAIRPEKKQKPKSDFVKNIIKFIEKKDFKIIEERDFKTKEYKCITQIKTELGPINFLTLAKDKKTISESDVKKLLGESQSIPLPSLLIYTGKLSKKAEEFVKDYFSIIKVLRFDSL